MIIKGKQMMIVDHRINKNVTRFYSDFYKKKYWKSSEYQNLLCELYLDTESFFYIATRIVDLIFEGFQNVIRIPKSNRKRFSRLLKIRNQLLEHSHKPGRPIEDEICQFGINQRYGVYVRSSKGADDGRPYRDRAYYPLRNGFVKNLIELIERAPGT